MAWLQIHLNSLIGHFTVVYLVAKPLIWSKAEGDLVVIETSMLSWHDNKVDYIRKAATFVS